MSLKKEHEVFPVEIEDVDMDRLERLSTDIPSLLEYAHSIGGFSITPFKENEIKNKAMTAMKQQTQMQLDMLYEQVQLIASQISNIQKRALASELIYDCVINFEPLIGQNYYIYSEGKKKNLSMISPEEWGQGRCPYLFIAEVELLADHTWKIIREN